LNESKIVDGSSGVSPLGPSGRVKAAIRKAAKSINTPPMEETERLKKLFKSKFGIASENLLFANSLKELVYFVTGALNPEKVVVIGPSLELYEDAGLAAGAEVCYIPAPAPDLSGMETSGIRGILSGADIVLLSNPNRITGKVSGWEKIRETLTEPADGSPHFVVDRALMEFAGEFGADNDLLRTGKMTVLGTTALFFGLPGLEIAFAVSSSETIRIFEEKKHWEINLLSIEAARAAYKDSSYVKNLNHFIAHEKSLLFRMLSKIERIHIYDSDTNLFLVRTENSPDETGVKLRRAGLDIMNCGNIKGLDSSFFIIAVMKHENNLKFISALKK
jgi:threonine-phosphate decarboxylase